MIGHTIHHHRIRRDLSLSELSRRSGVSKSYISNLERGKQQNPSLSKIKAISSALNVHYSVLLEEE